MMDDMEKDITGQSDDTSKIKMTNEENKPKFEVGQEVVVARALGTRTDRPKGGYYYGGTVEWVPLGAKAIIDRIGNEDIVHFSFPYISLQQ